MLPRSFAGTARILCLHPVAGGSKHLIVSIEMSSISRRPIRACSVSFGAWKASCARAHWASFVLSPFPKRSVYAPILGLARRVGLFRRRRWRAIGTCLRKDKQRPKAGHAHGHTPTNHRLGPYERVFLPDRAKDGDKSQIGRSRKDVEGIFYHRESGYVVVRNGSDRLRCRTLDARRRDIKRLGCDKAKQRTQDGQLNG